MGKFGNAIDAVKAAKTSGGDYQKTSYLKINNGETKTVRFISAFREMYIYSCSDPNCACKNAEISKDEFDALRMAGKSPVCPICNKVISESNIVGERPAFVPSMLHMERITKNDGSQAWRTFLCLSDSPEQKDAAGNPLYPCPICAQVDAKGKKKNPAMRLTGVAVVRNKVTEQVATATGQTVNKVVDVVDEMITDDDGNTVPHIVLVQMGVKNFFNALMAIDEYSPVQFYDFDITRTGEKLETNYMFTPLTQADNPQPVNIENYRQYIPDVESMLCAIGSPAYYSKNGFNVQGYVPEDVQNNDNVAPNANNSQVSGYVQNPIAANIGVGQTVSFDQVASQMNGYSN